MDTVSPAADRPLGYRDATPADVGALVELIESAYRGETSRGGWTTEADYIEGRRTDRQSVLSVIEKPDSRMLVVERDGTVIACCQLERRGDAAYFGMFAVRPGLQGGGLGRRILAEAERFAGEQWGALHMQMTVVSVREELIAYYERRGYRRTGRMSPFPYDDERFGLPTRPGLQFELLVKDLAGAAQGEAAQEA